VTALSEALEAVALTDTGRMRDHNEDAVFVDAACGVAILADGMGGCNAGEVASGMAVAVLSETLKRDFSAHLLHGAKASRNSVERIVLERVAATNAVIFETSLKQPEYTGMGTTLVAAVFHDDHVTIAHLGDSRLYLLRGGELRVMTRDHSLLQEQMDAGLLVVGEGLHYEKNLVTRALGVDSFVNTESRTCAARPGDIYLLCSDGLSNMLDERDIQLILEPLSGDIEQAAKQLVDMANNRGGYDNVSVVLIKILREFPALEAAPESALKTV
jgi:protein phosphatase